MKVDYLLLDVFTTQRLAGNPLAVVLDADGLLDDQMQAIANEFNLSETVFLMRPASERHTASVRIFNPVAEMPFAGHPTVGAAVVLALEERLTAVRMEEKIGLITALIELNGKNGGRARFALPRLPEPAGKAPDAALVARALGIEKADIGSPRFRQVALYSAGVLYYLVPVRDAGVLKRLEPQGAYWRDAFPLGDHGVYIFAETPATSGADLAARMFWMPNGLAEDPGTGSAAAALIGLLSAQAGFADGQGEYRLRQGVEMGRPCEIMIQLRKENDVLTHGGIGGDAVIVGRGTLDLGD